MRKMRKTAMSTLALAASLTVLVAGCGGNTTGTNNAQSKDNTKPVDGGTLSIGQWEKFNPEFIPFVDQGLYTYNITAMAYDPLLATDKNLNYIPWLAKSWDWSSDKKTLTMHLQPNANWSDGQPITSDDVLYAMDYLASPDYTNALQGQYEFMVDNVVGADKIQAGKATSFADVGGFKKIDDKTFSIAFKTADAAVLYADISALCPVPAHILKTTKIKDWATLPEDKQPTVTDGPFTFQQVTTDTVTMKANPNYWAGKPHIDTVVWKTVSPDVAPGLLQSGQLDYMMNGLKAKDAAKMSSMSGIVVKTPPELGYEYVGLKNYIPEFKDVRVRQAFEYALDRDAMAKGIYKGFAVPIESYLPATSWAAATEADGINPYKYDTAKAGQLLDAAGWTKQSDGTRIDPVTHKPAEFSLIYPSGNPDRAAEAIAIKQYLGAIGVKVDVQSPMDFNELLKKVDGDDKSVQMWILGWGESADPDPRGVWRSNDGFNDARFKDPHNDALIADTASMQAFDTSYRKQALVKWQVYLNQQMPVLFLYSRPQVFAFSSKLHVPDKDMSALGPIFSQDWWVQ